MSPHWGPRLHWHAYMDFWLTCIGIGTVAGLIVILINVPR